jgi:alpha-beta hydrolase superfamily lysophospholipase
MHDTDGRRAFNLASPDARMLTRRALLAGGASLSLGGCVGISAPAGPAVTRPALDAGEFVMPDGTRLPYRSWLPAAEPEAVILALHGFNDSRDAWEIPAIDFNAAGYAVYAPDQRGFGATARRGLWAGTPALVDDAAEMARLVRQRHPASRLVLMGESMGGAVLMCLATSPRRPPGARYVLSAPAVWGRATMNVFLRGSLWVSDTLVPGLALTGAPVRVTACDNRAALIRLSRDPLTLHATRVDTLRGLVDLMDAALASAAAFTEPGLFLYGGRDELVPKGAMATMWRRLPRGGAREAYYPRDYHLMLRDLGRAVPLGDVVSWVREPSAPLPSGADRAAATWLSRQA